VRQAEELAALSARRAAREARALAAARRRAGEAEAALEEARRHTAAAREALDETRLGFGGLPLADKPTRFEAYAAEEDRKLRALGIALEAERSALTAAEAARPALGVARAALMRAEGRDELAQAARRRALSREAGRRDARLAEEAVETGHAR
jgi:hypothetical protein